MTKSERKVMRKLVREEATFYHRGWPDFLTMKGETVVLMEIKSGSQKLSKEQKQMHRVLRKQGLKVITVNTDLPNWTALVHDALNHPKRVKKTKQVVNVPVVVPVVPKPITTFRPVVIATPPQPVVVAPQKPVGSSITLNLTEQYVIHVPRPRRFNRKYHERLAELQKKEILPFRASKVLNQKSNLIQ